MRTQNLAKMKLHEIFEHVGLTREQVAIAAKHVANPNEPAMTVVRKSKNRPTCLVCGKHINALNCAPIRK
jgi:hypothetical protein